MLYGHFTFLERALSLDWTARPSENRADKTHPDSLFQPERSSHSEFLPEYPVIITIGARDPLRLMDDSDLANGFWYHVMLETCLDRWAKSPLVLTPLPGANVPRFCFGIGRK
jgi:hypothetical protein